MGHSQTDLDMATRHVAEGEERIRLMRWLISRRIERGQDTRLSEGVLETMLVTMQIMLDHKTQITAERKLLGLA